MEFIKANFLNTTTQIAVNNNTGTISNLFNPDPYYQYYTDGMNNDLTTASLTITFDATTYVSRIALVDHNVKDFVIYYNGATANTFALTTASSTIASSFISNSETSQYFTCATVACTSITLDLKKTITANSEKYLGNLYVSELYLSFPQLPSASKFKPKIIPKQIVHKLSDGGTRLHNIRRKRQDTIDLQYISESFRDGLLSVYELLTPFIYCPFGTTTSWDEQIYEAVWEGEFEFYEYSDDASTSGFTGTIKLKETPT